MTFNEAVIYGVVQGLTELLPVSSSAHLAITHWLLGTTNPESDLAHFHLDTPNFLLEKHPHV